MKLTKYLLTAASLLLSLSASADIVRLHHTYKQTISEDSVYVVTVEDDIASLAGLLNIYYPEDGWQSEGRRFVGIKSGWKECSKISALSGLRCPVYVGDKIEFLRPEKVKLEVDVPDAFPALYNEEYEIILNGKVYLIDDSDEVINGLLEAESGGFLELGTFHCESQSVSFYENKPNLMAYKLGGEFGREIKFQLIAKSKEFRSENRIYNQTRDGNSFTDFVQWGVSMGYSNFGTTNTGSEFAVTTTEDMTAVTKDVEFRVNEFICHYGAKATFRIDDNSLIVNGETIPLSQYGDYVKFNPVMEINENTLPFCYLPLEYNFSSFDLSKPNEVGFTLLLDSLELASETPELVRKTSEYRVNKAFIVSLKTFVGRNEVDRLTIDPAKVSFPDIEETEGSIAALFDDNPNTFCHSSWSTAKPRSEPYGSYLDIEFEAPIQELGFAMQTRHNSTPLGFPKNMRLYWSNDGETWNLLAEPEVSGTYSFSEWIEEFNKPKDRFKAPEPFKYLRFSVIKNGMDWSLTKTKTETSEFWNLAELHFYGK